MVMKITGRRRVGRAAGRVGHPAGHPVAGGNRSRGLQKLTAIGGARHDETPLGREMGKGMLPADTAAGFCSSACRPPGQVQLPAGRDAFLRFDLDRVAAEPDHAAVRRHSISRLNTQSSLCPAGRQVRYRRSSSCPKLALIVWQLFRQAAMHLLGLAALVKRRPRAGG